MSWAESDTLWTKVGQQHKRLFSVFSVVWSGSGDPAARRIQQSWCLPLVSVHLHYVPLYYVDV